MAHDRRELDSGLISFGVLLGMAIGGVVTLLYAPLTGRELLKQAERGVENLERSVNQVEGSLNEGRAAVLARRSTQ
jgi:gas vesicle protein